MEEPKPNGSEVREENKEPENIYVGADGTEEVAVAENGKKFKVIFCVLQNLTPLLQRPYFLERRDCEWEILYD
jgi:hypothetical protein